VRILLLAPMVPQADGLGAIPKLLDAELRGLAARHEVTFVGAYGDLPGQAEAAAALRAEGFDAHFLDGRRSAATGERWRVRALLASTWARKPYPWRAVPIAARLQPVLDRAIAGREFDVVAIEDSVMSVFALPAGVPTVLTEHEAERAAASEWSGGSLLERPLRMLQAADWRRVDGFQRRAWHRFDLLQVFSDSDADEVRRREPAVAPRLRVVPFGMELPAAADPAGEEPDLVLFTGTFTHLPNRDAARWLATEIAPAIRARRPGARLRIVGSAPPREVLDLAGEGVEVVADAPSIDPHLAAAAVVIAPVRSGGGMRLKVLEALGRGKAVVTTPRGTEGFAVFGEQLPLAVGADPEALAVACAGLLEDEGERRALGAAARNFAERRCSPGPWAERLERVYEEARAATAREAA
jgi:glycosyltransferase involved in cell wall biosynthesis